MTGLVRLPVWALIALAVVSAAGCAPMGQQKSPVIKPSVSVSGPFPDEAAKAVFSSAYASIAERHIEPVRVKTLAISGMHGLTDLDPAVRIDADDGDVVIERNDAEIARFEQPDADDVDGWVNVTVEVASTVRGVSPSAADADMEDMYESMLDSAAAKLDKFSRYASPDETGKNRARRAGFGGIGVRFRVESGTAVVTGVTAGSSADVAGVLTGDRVTHIDGGSTAGLSAKAIASRLGGPAGTLVLLTIERETSPTPRSLRISRTHIIPETVDVRRDDNVIFLTVSGFNEASLDRIRSALTSPGDGRQPAIRGVVLDLRGNPGGLFLPAVRIADLFVANGPLVLTRGRHPHSNRIYHAANDDIIAGVPMVVLVDGGSASAAEVLAAALSDTGRAVVVGTNSYGKGSVQTVIPLPNGGELILTWSKLVAPSGHDLDHQGVAPAICTSGQKEIGGERQLDALAGDFIKASQRRSQQSPSCPAEPRDGNLELTIARQVLDDRTIYARSLHHPSPLTVPPDRAELDRTASAGKVPPHTNGDDRSP